MTSNWEHWLDRWERDNERDDPPRQIPAPRPANPLACFTTLELLAEIRRRLETPADPPAPE